MKRHLIITSLIFISNAYATNHLVLMGGGGEPQGSGTIFDTTIEKFSDYYQKNSWGSTSVVFNGGHSNTEKIIAKNLNQTNTPFTEKNYNDLINKYKNQISNKSIPAGDQLIIYIDSHGAEKYGSQKTHDIATSGQAIKDYNTLAGSATVSLDNLKELSELALKNGVKLAIIDMSCHSGNTLALANPKTCVISASGPKHYSFAGQGTFGYNFSSLMKKGSNLESIFLEARKKAVDRGYPMISTLQNAYIQNFVYEAIGPYLYYYDVKNDKLTPYLTQIATGNSCKRETGFNQLNEVIKKIEQLNIEKTKFLMFEQNKKNIDLSSLVSDLNEYKKIQDELIAKLAKLNLNKLNNIEKISSDSTKGRSYKLEVKWSELLAANYEKWRDDAQEKVNKGIDPENNALLVSLYKNAINKRNEILNQNPQFKNLQNEMQSFGDLNSKSNAYSIKIADQEKKLYDAVYKSLPQPGPNEPNPCRDFVL